MKSASGRQRVMQSSVRALADQAFSRAGNAPLVEGNHVRLLIDARENYPAWLDAIHSSRRYIHIENYIIHDDATGRLFADALIARAREGLQVRLVYDWLGCFRTASRSLWTDLRAGGVEVRCYNPPQWNAPLGWISRNHRKTLTVDGSIAFVTGLCIGDMWVGQPDQQIEPWRDTGVEIRGPAVADVEQAFAEVWTMTGEPLPPDALVDRASLQPTGSTAVRIVAGLPATAGTFRVDQLVAALARKRLWLTDAYYAGMAAYVQALCAAAQDGVDVRLLVPNATDIPVLKPLSRAGYRTLLEAGIRVFEWNGTMLHAKTAVADGRWARVGSTNLNIASWLANCELDVVVEDEHFAANMEQVYERDLQNATEVVLDARRRVRAPGQPLHPRAIRSRGGGSGSRAAAGAIRLSNAFGAAFGSRRVLEPVDARISLVSGAVLAALAILFVLLPRVLAYPAALILAWFAVVLIHRAYRLYRQRFSQDRTHPATTPPRPRTEAIGVGPAGNSPGGR